MVIYAGSWVYAIFDKNSKLLVCGGDFVSRELKGRNLSDSSRFCIRPCSFSAYSW